jgi:hypothetical protein
MLAVLEDAVRTFKEYAVLSNPRVRRLHAEVERWFESPSTNWPFDFENICDALGFEPSSIRSALRRWQAVVTPSPRVVAVSVEPMPWFERADVDAVRLVALSTW